MITYTAQMGALRRVMFRCQECQKLKVGEPIEIDVVELFEEADLTNDIGFKPDKTIFVCPNCYLDIPFVGGS